MTDRQCSSCGGFCKKSGCERENTPHEVVTRRMFTAAHGVTLATGDIILSGRLIEKIYLAMCAARDAK